MKFTMIIYILKKRGIAHHYELEVKNDLTT